MLSAIPGFTPSQMEEICQAIRLHDEKDVVHQPLDEVLKDADVVQPYLYNPALKARKPVSERLRAPMRELGVVL
jgi:hypothetical protein